MVNTTVVSHVIDLVIVSGIPTIGLILLSSLNFGKKTIESNEWKYQAKRQMIKVKVFKISSTGISASAIQRKFSQTKESLLW